MTRTFLVFVTPVTSPPRSLFRRLMSLPFLVMSFHLPGCHSYENVASNRSSSKGCGRMPVESHHLGGGRCLWAGGHGGRVSQVQSGPGAGVSFVLSNQLGSFPHRMYHLVYLSFGCYSWFLIGNTLKVVLYDTWYTLQSYFCM